MELIGDPVTLLEIIKEMEMKGIKALILTNINNHENSPLIVEMEEQYGSTTILNIHNNSEEINW